MKINRGLSNQVTGNLSKMINLVENCTLEPSETFNISHSKQQLGEYSDVALDCSDDSRIEAGGFTDLSCSF